MRYRKVGYFHELADHERRDQLTALRRDTAVDDESKIVDYLKSGIDAGAVMMIENDVLATSSKAIGEVLLKSDGVWIWPTSLAYYVKEYHLSLPTEFIEHMVKNDWRVPDDAEYLPVIPQGHIQM